MMYSSTVISNYNYYVLDLFVVIICFYVVFYVLLLICMVFFIVLLYINLLLIKIGIVMTAKQRANKQIQVAKQRIKIADLYDKKLSVMDEIKIKKAELKQLVGRRR